MKGNIVNICRNLLCHCNRQVKIFIIYFFIFGNWYLKLLILISVYYMLSFLKKYYQETFTKYSTLIKKHNFLLHFLKSQLFQKPQFQKFNQTHPKNERKNTYVWYLYLWDNYSLFSFLLWDALKMKRRMHISDTLYLWDNCSLFSTFDKLWTYISNIFRGAEMIQMHEVIEPSLNGEIPM